MSSTHPSHFNLLLSEWRKGNQEASAQLIALVYHDLRRLARQYMSQERVGHTLQPTALVHEVYLRLFGNGPQKWNDREHFFAVAARQMRRLLIDHARIAGADKRRLDRIENTAAQESGLALNLSGEELLALDEALQRLEKINHRACQVVELRFYSGCTEPEAAQALGISVATLKREWTFARAWLYDEMNGAEPSK